MTERADRKTQRNFKRDSIYEYAHSGNHEAVLKMLEAGGVEVDSCGYTGYTALHYAAGQGEQGYQLVKALIKYGANVNARNRLSETALHCAAYDGHIPTIELLLNANADINAMSRTGMSPLAVIKYERGYDALLFLLENGADPDITDNMGFTVLMHCTKSGLVNFIEKLLQHDANPNVQSKDGTTALHLAALGYLEITRLLLEHGAKQVANAAGITPIEIAERYKRTKVAELLREYA